MDNYFQAAVVDLDKLLDDFEQNTDELETYQSSVASVNLNQYFPSSGDFYLQPDFPAPVKPQSNCDVSQPCLPYVRSTDKVADVTSLNPEKNVTGLDLLSCVDGGTSDEDVSSVGRVVAPLCDLISDTGSVITVGNIHKSLISDSLHVGNLTSDHDLHADPSLATIQSSAGLHEFLKPDEEKHGFDTPVDSDLLPMNPTTLPFVNPDIEGLSSYVDPGLNEDYGPDKDSTDTTSSTTSLSSSNTSSTDGYVSEELPYEIVNQNPICLVLQDGETESTTSSSEPETTNLETLENLASVGRAELQGSKGEVKSVNDRDSDFGKECLLETEPENEETSEIRRVDTVLSTPSTSIGQEQTQYDLPKQALTCNTPSTTGTEEPKAPIKEVDSMVSGHGVSANELGVLPQTDASKGREKTKDVQPTSVINDGGNFPDEQSHYGLGKSNHQLTSSLPIRDEYNVATLDPVINPTSDNDFKNLTLCDLDVHRLLSNPDDLLMSSSYISDAELDAFLTGNMDTFCRDVPLEANFPITEDSSNMEPLSRTCLNVCSDGHSTETFGTVEAMPENNPCKAESAVLAAESQNIIPNVHPQSSAGDCQLPNANTDSHIGGARPKQLFHQPPEKLNSKVSRDETPEEPAADPCSRNSSCLPKTENVVGNTPGVLKKPLNLNLNDGSNNRNMAKLEDERPSNLLLGQCEPKWIPDSEAPSCMYCKVKFTFTKRRHHCRACGKVFCAVCCSQKCKLPYLEKEARICVLCNYFITKVQAFASMMSPTGSLPNPYFPSEYSPTIPDLMPAQAAGFINSPPPTVLVPGSVLKQPGTEGPGQKEQKRVWFADGLLPNGEVADTSKLAGIGKRPSQDSSPITPTSPLCSTTAGEPLDKAKGSDTPSNESSPELSCALAPLDEAASSTFKVNSIADYTMLCGIEKCVSRQVNLIPGDEHSLPPLLLASGEGGDPLVSESPTNAEVTFLLEDDGPNPLTFILNANLLVNVKLVSYASEKCWFFASNGLQSVGQPEIVVLLTCLSGKDPVPKDIFKLLINIYKDAQKGKYVGNLDNITFTESFLGSKDHGGILFFTPTFQDLSGLSLPNNPFLCGVIIQKMEVPWAKVFPIRLILRLGFEFGEYPAPVASRRNRKSVFGEIGHTIFNLLTDLRNYQYTIPHVDGLVIHMEMGKTCIKIPSKKQNEILKVIHASNEHVISIGASFSLEADSHLVCVQNSDGLYQTQANIASGKTRQDGLMVQITQETMEALRQALRDKKDFRIACGKIDSGELAEEVTITWVDTQDTKNKGISSPIDGQPMEGVISERLCQETDFEAHDKIVKCTEVFYLLRDREPPTAGAHSQFAKEIATACGAALCPHIKTLKNSGMNKIGLRVSMDIDMVEYRAGSGGELLPQVYLNDLDSALIPVIHNRTSDSSILPLVMELIFFLIESLK
uniref:Zinc finger FYVE domain-containing protein n=1 Tax=Leptobrachium leishanense TaxID=445787 RepID=A0A8C5LNJ4_9ANUR